MFEPGSIWAFPTDTSFGLAVRADDKEGLESLANLKGRKPGMFFSLMVRDFEMFRQFADVPENFPKDFFLEKPRTAILEPTFKLPRSSFWPAEKVAFRVATIPEVAREISYPITATSANLTGESPIFETETLQKKFGDKIKIFPGFETLSHRASSEIWDFTTQPARKVR